MEEGRRAGGQEGEWRRTGAANECATAECCRALLCGANFAQWVGWVWRGAGRKLRAHLRAGGTRSAALLR